MLRHREFLAAVNHATLLRYFPIIGDLPKERQVRIAKHVRKLRRSTAQRHVMRPDVRELIQWIHSCGTPIFLVTGIERDLVRGLVQQTPRSIQRSIAGVCTAGDLGINKLSERFWSGVLERFRRSRVELQDLEPHELIMIGNDVPIDASCTALGIPVLIFDRGGIRRRFYREREGSEDVREWYGVRFLDAEGEIPPRASFIAFAETIVALRVWLERLRPNSSGSPSST